MDDADLGVGEKALCRPITSREVRYTTTDGISELKKAIIRISTAICQAQDGAPQPDMLARQHRLDRRTTWHWQTHSNSSMKDAHPRWLPPDPKSDGAE